MEKFLFEKRILKIICLLVMVGILCVTPKLEVQAAAVDDSGIVGETEERTYINEPGSAQTQEELSQLNIANNLTVTTYKDGNGQLSGDLRILLTLTMISIAPILLIMLTSFTRIIIVLHFTRAALNTQTAPPNQVLIGLALFLTYFIMQPTLTQVYEEAVVPFEAGKSLRMNFSGQE